MKSTGISLSVRFAITIIGLTVVVVTLLAVALVFFTTENLKITLGMALQQRTQILLESLVARAGISIQTRSLTEPEFLLAPVSAMRDEVLYCTITGPSLDKVGGQPTVWATNDPDIQRKIDTASLVPGVSVINDQVASELAAVAGQAQSVPAFDPRNLLSSNQTRYLFYLPYFSLNVGDRNSVRGLVRVEVSTLVIEKQILSSRNTMIGMILLIGDLAVALSLVVAWGHSARTLKPIRHLSAQMASMGRRPIEVGADEEFEELASGVNDLTRLASELMGLKGLQKHYFITLDKDEAGYKLTTYRRDLPGIEVFAYYEGAKTVSGDLLEFRQLDASKNKNSPWYGLLKGDISGNGAEALLSMSITAAGVTNFFRNWTHAKDGRQTDIAKMLNNLNNYLEPILGDIGYQKFAALNAGVLNSDTGELQFAQAGDRLLHLWRASTPQQPAHFELLELEHSAPLGLDASRYHQHRFRNQKLQLFPGDVLLYLTDGLEEGYSLFRDAHWRPIEYFDPRDLSTATPPGTRKRVPIFEGGPLCEIPGQGSEGFGTQRVAEIIKAYQHGEQYALVKQNWLHPEIVYHFDFSTCDGSAQGLVIALISINRIFRLVPDPRATEFDSIDLDLVEDGFLRNHFVEFDRYFKNGFVTYRQAILGKDNSDKDGSYLTGAKLIPLWQKGSRDKGDEVDAEGFKLVGGERVPDWEKARMWSKESRDAEGYRLVDGNRVRAFVKGDRAKGDSVSPEGYKLEGGVRELSNPGYIRYTHLKEDAQFDDLTLLAIRKK